MPVFSGRRRIRMISVWVAMCSICCVSGLHISVACSGDPYSLTGFDRLDYAAWCAFEDFARTILPFVGFERLTENCRIYREGVDGSAASRADTTLWIPDAARRGGARANLTMPGA
jgi:hypothetical protein